MRKNYQAWEINYDDFYLLKNDADKLHFLLKFAVLAPSTHNSQPWNFAVRDKEILVLPNLERTLSVSDPEHRFLFISLGCAIENIVIAADYYNYQTTVEYFTPNTNEAVAKISFETTPTTVSNRGNHLILAIPRRRTNRNKYTVQMPEKEFLSFLQNLKLDSVSIHLVLDSKTQATIADILMISRIKAFDDKLFRRELAHYKRTNLTNSPLGMPGFTMGFNTPFSLIAPFVIRHVNVIHFLRKQEESLLTKHTPVFGFVVTRGDSKVDWLKAGRLYERVALEAEHRTIQTAISAISPQAREQFQEILGISSFPQIFFRMGYTNKFPPHSPRLSFEDIVIEKS